MATASAPGFAPSGARPAATALISWPVSLGEAIETVVAL